MGDDTGHRPVGRAVLALIVLAAIWGYNWVVMKRALHDIDPVTFAALRTGLGGSTLFLLLCLRGGAPLPRPVAGVAILGFLQITLFLALTVWALSAGGAGKTAVLVYTMPFWTLVMARIFLGERLSRLQALAAVVALAGLVLVLEPWRLGGASLSNCLAVLAGVTWGASVIVAKRLPHNGEGGLLALTAWQMLFGAVPLVLWAVLSRTPRVVWSHYLIGAIVYNVLFANALAWLLWLYVVQRLPAGVAGLGSLAIPVVGVLAAWLELGERPGGAEGAGMALLGVALFLLTCGGALRRHSTADGTG